MTLVQLFQKCQTRRAKLVSPSRGLADRTRLTVRISPALKIRRQYHLEVFERLRSTWNVRRMKCASPIDFPSKPRKDMEHLDTALVASS